jgi:hypothetical protein
MAKQKRVRSPRFSVPNNEQVVVSVGSEKLKGTLHVPSRISGAIRIDKRYSFVGFAAMPLSTRPRFHNSYPTPKALGRYNQPRETSQFGRCLKLRHRIELLEGAGEGFDRLHMVLAETSGYCDSK